MAASLKTSPKASVGEMRAGKEMKEGKKKVELAERSK